MLRHIQLRMMENILEWENHNKTLSVGGLYANEQQVREVYSFTTWGSNGHSIQKKYCIIPLYKEGNMLF